MVAEVVATPVLERLRAGAGAGVVRGATARAAYLDLGGFVVALTAPGVPLMPNGIAVPRTDVADGAVRAGPEAIVLPGGEAVSWDGAARWDPTLRRAAPEDASALRARAAAVLDALGLVDAQAGAAPAFAAPDGTVAHGGRRDGDPVRHERDPRRGERDDEAAQVEVGRARGRAAHDARGCARAQALQDRRRDDLGDHRGRR